MTKQDLLLQTSWCSRHQLDIDNIRRYSGLHKHIKTFKKNAYKQAVWDVQLTLTSTTPSTRSTSSSMHNKLFRTLPPRQYVEQVNFLLTSPCMLQNRTASRTTYYADYNEQTSSSDINMLQELVYNSAPCYRNIVHPQLCWTETSQQQQFRDWIQDATR